MFGRKKKAIKPMSFAIAVGGRKPIGGEHVSVSTRITHAYLSVYDVWDVVLDAAFAVRELADDSTILTGPVVLFRTDKDGIDIPVAVEELPYTVKSKIYDALDLPLVDTK